MTTMTRLNAESNKRHKDIIESDLAVNPAPQTRQAGQSFIGLNKERFSKIDLLPESVSRSGIEKKFQSLPTLEIKHPLVNFISDLTQSLSECSDFCLRPLPTIGISNVPRKEIDLSGVLHDLEAGEKRLNLLSHARSTLDPLSNTSRHMAHEAAFLVRSLRRNLISTSTDPAHPGEQRTASMLELVDTLAYRLHEIRLNFEDLAAGLFLESSLAHHAQDKTS